MNNSDVQSSIREHKKIARIVFQNMNVQCIESMSMLSMDCGTGYYLAQISDVQKEYSQQKLLFCVGPNGNRQVTTKKEPSTVFVSPSFDLKSVPRIIHEETKIENLL